MNALTAKKSQAMKIQLAVVTATVALLLAGCTEPVPPCLILRSSGAAYASQWLNGTITAGAGGPNCAVFGTGPFTGTGSAPGTQVDLATTSSIYPYGFTGGFPFRVQLFGVDKYAPASTGGSSQISIAPEIFYQGTDQAGYVIGNLEAEDPNAQSLCFVPTFQAAATGTFGWGGTTGDLDVSLTFSNMTLYETTAIPGTQFTADVTATVSDVGGGNACTATYNVLAFAQATTCMTLVFCDANNVCDLSNGGQAPYADDQVQDNLCTDFNPPSGDQMWINYAANGLPAGAATNRQFPIACDQTTGYCVLPPPATGTPTLPVVGAEPRP